MNTNSNMNTITKPDIFQTAPLPWRYDSQTRNVIAADGSIVCRNGDDVYGVPEIGEAIVKMFNAQSEPTKEQSLLSAIEGNFEGMAQVDLVLTCKMLTRGREAWRKEADSLKSKLETPSCLYVQHGRGDCEHFIGLPKEMNEKTTDTYGKPNDWCWFCWLSYRLAKASLSQPGVEA